MRDQYTGSDFEGEKYMITAICPECENPIVLDPSPEIGDVLRCKTCQTFLEVTWLYPISLDYPEKPIPKKNPDSARRKIPGSGNGGET
jgi:hypothetical protein